MGFKEEFLAGKFTVYAQCDGFVKVFDNAWLRFATYLIFSGVIWASLSINGSVLVVGAGFLTVACLCYLVAALRKQERFTSAMTGGTGVSTSPV
ncbi:Golgi apparatus membrane protein tvp18 [Dispira simplex]|nr:Golgi apparatus membrane protein tvp18 [Dispira simplex]